MPVDAQDPTRLAEANLVVFGTLLALFRAILDKRLRPHQLNEALLFFSTDMRKESRAPGRFQRSLTRPRTSEDVRSAHEAAERVIKAAIEGQRLVWKDDVGENPMAFLNGLLVTHGWRPISAPLPGFNYYTVSSLAWEEQRIAFVWR